MLRSQCRQVSLIAFRGANSDVFADDEDLNRICDEGCLRIVGEIGEIHWLCKAMEISFKTRKLDYFPFIHRYRKESSNPEFTICIWDLPLIDLYGTAVPLPFYVLRGDGFLLLRNDFIRMSDRLNSKNLFVIQPGQCGLSQKKPLLPIYLGPVKSTDPRALRTYLIVLWTKNCAFQG